MTIPYDDIDVLVVGSGFGGSLTALLCRQIGLMPLVVDARAHPRFAIGESTTPLGNLVLESLAQEYDLPWLAPLANYASWKQSYPQLGVGLKRGFSYFQHVRGQPFAPAADHANELLVAASHAPEDADTHWLRADFDQFLVQQVRAAGIPVHDHTQLGSLQPHRGGWIVQGDPTRNAPAGQERLTIRAKFIVDATGDGGFLTRQLQIPAATQELRTWSRAVFGHFRGVRPWNELYRELGGQSQEHPFVADDAALHHVFDGGWMWNLRFDDGLMSAGFCLDSPGDGTLSPAEEWRQLLDQFPSIAEQYRDAVLVAPSEGIVRTGRMQRCVAQAAGSNWALLPYAAGFIDPLHSTGNSHTLLGIERLIRALQRHWGQPELAAALADYDERVRLEVRQIDRIVAGSYLGFADFPRMVAMSLFYFATAIWSEVRRRSGVNVPRAFLCADEPELQASAERCLALLSDSSRATSEIVDEVRRAIQPFNIARLGDPARRNLYPYV